jgi:hypothetical protein
MQKKIPKPASPRDSLLLLLLPLQLACSSYDSAAASAAAVYEGTAAPAALPPPTAFEIQSRDRYVDYELMLPSICSSSSIDIILHVIISKAACSSSPQSHKNIASHVSIQKDASSARLQTLCSR